MLAPEGSEEAKQTNETGMFVSLLEGIDDIAGKTITTDALLTQRKPARYLVKLTFRASECRLFLILSICNLLISHQNQIVDNAIIFCFSEPIQAMSSENHVIRILPL